MALPTLRIIGFIIGIFLITLAIAMVVPMATLVVFERTGDLPSFLWASMITFIAGLALVIPGRPEHVHLRPRDMHVPADRLQLAGGVHLCRPAIPANPAHQLHRLVL